MAGALFIVVLEQGLALTIKGGLKINPPQHLTQNPKYLVFTI